jgi:hypothetical protein
MVYHPKRHNWLEFDGLNVVYHAVLLPHPKYRSFSPFARVRCDGELIPIGASGV